MNIFSKMGYWLEENRGNNSFSYYPGKKIWIPEIKVGNIDDINLGDKIVFSERIDGKLIESKGLKSHIWILENSEPPIFICDNHNRVLESWRHFKDKKPLLVHIDQHRDEADYGNINSWEKDLRVCDYIPWTKDNNWIQASHISLCESKDFASFDPKILDGKDYILNVDLDIFVPEQTFINHDHIKDIIRKLSKNAVLVSYATSPLFIDQEKAISIIRKLIK